MIVHAACVSRTKYYMKEKANDFDHVCAAAYFWVQDFTATRNLEANTILIYI
jgi:hypothetical protein